MRILTAAFLILFFSSFQTRKEKTVELVLSPTSHARLMYGAEQLGKALKAAGYTVKITRKKSIPRENAIVITDTKDPLFEISPKNPGNPPSAKESFSIFSVQKNIIISGADQSGALYGCLELAAHILKNRSLPENISIKDGPQMVLRGTCIGLQKTNYLPGRTVYEYPYTPESFPWFYDKKLWLRYLDSMAVNRYNSLYLWNGHPFASLVKLKDYPYALEVDDSTFQKNEEIFRFLSTEADKRGIWIIQMFYNIILSKPFAEKHGLKTQDRAIQVTPLIADYTRKSIAAFVEKYPNVGLLVTLGEALEGEEQEVEWFTKTIIGGVQDGLRAMKRADQPPIVLRGHDTNPQKVMKAALPLYRNLYTMNKYNGEALTTYEPRGPWAQMHREMSALGSVHIDNVHILANLEPFRYGSAEFIQKSVQAMKKIHGANGLHLYPESSYWEWPYSADRHQERLLQIERDWVWYKAWARYAWNAGRQREEEILYWSNLLAGQFGISLEGGRNVLTALEESGEIAPKLLRRFGITNGNRQTLTLGMTMSQLVNPYKHRVWPELFSSDGPEGEMLIEYVAREWKGQAHKGETPPQIVREVLSHAQKSVRAIDNASSSVAINRDEFNRLKNDIYCYHALSNFFSEKVQAAIIALRYKYSKDINDLRKAIPHLERSVEFYRVLAGLTANSYLYANSMQTGQRKIPVGGDGGRNKTWVEILPVYEKELVNFKRRLDSLDKVPGGEIPKSRTPLKNENIAFIGENIESFTLDKGQSVFNDSVARIDDMAGELNGLKGIRFSKKEQIEKGTTFTFTTQSPVQVLVGYFTGQNQMYLRPSSLETDAGANDRGQAEIKISNAMDIDQMPGINIHSFLFAPGKHTMTLGRGAVLILGFVSGNQPVTAYDAGMKGDRAESEIDWLFE